LTYEKLLKFFKKNDKGTSRIHTFFSMVETRKTLHQNTIAKVREEGGNILKGQIPYRSDVEKMGIYREPVLVSSPHSESAQTYIELWDEIKSVSS
ncbi:MAG: ParA family protein, partial [Thermodesulfobacteriota bacterium]